MNGPREEQAGIGELRALDGTPLLQDARYALTIDHAPIAGGLPYHSRRDPESAGWRIPCARGRSEVLLKLEDGREWDCLTD